jgi:methyl-accepting chemotaxis protein
LKNLPIIVKLMAIIAAFGFFSLGTAFYAAHQMRQINDNYTALMAGNGQAEVAMARATRRLSDIRNGVAETILGDSPAQEAIGKALMETGITKAKLFADQAAVDAPAHAGAIENLKTRMIDLVTSMR